MDWTCTGDVLGGVFHHSTNLRMEKAVQWLSRQCWVPKSPWRSITEVEWPHEIDPSNLKKNFLTLNNGHGRQMLSRDEEKILVTITVASSRLHSEIALRSIGPAAEAALPDKKMFRRGFYKGFMKSWRHVLSIRKPQALTDARTSPDGFDKTMEWAEAAQ